MTVILVLLTFVIALVVNYLTKLVPDTKHVVRGTAITTPGFELLGALAQDGGKIIEEDTDGKVE